MPGTRSRRTAALIVVALGGAGALIPALASADEVSSPPGASYRMSAYYIYTGQTSTLIQSYLSDEDTPVAEVSQIIDWGDGTIETVPGTTTEITHHYPMAGTFTPRVIVSDGTNQSATGKETPGSVSVTAPMGGFKVDRTSAWAGDAVALTHHTSSDMTSVRVSWGDGTTSTVPATVADSKVKHIYKTAGTYAVKASAVNANGATTPRSAGTVVAKLDTTKPTVTLTRPASPTRATSWATVKGRSADVGRGVATVALAAVTKRGSSWYYYTGSAWKKATSYAAAGTKTKAVTVTPGSTGAWSTKFKGMAKGKLLIKYTALDRAGNASAQQKIEQTISR